QPVTALAQHAQHLRLGQADAPFEHLLSGHGKHIGLFGSGSHKRVSSELVAICALASLRPGALSGRPVCREIHFATASSMSGLPESPCCTMPVPATASPVTFPPRPPFRSIPRRTRRRTTARALAGPVPGT